MSRIGAIEGRDSAEFLPTPAFKNDDTLYSLIIPVYKNEENIESLVEALVAFDRKIKRKLQVVFVIDGSPDRSGEFVYAARSKFQFHYKIAFHSRNFGSFTAIRTGLELSDGAFVAVMAADLQEPVELIERFFDSLSRNACDVAFGVRESREDAWLDTSLSNAFWWLYRRMVLPDMPKGGVDIFACNSHARAALLSIREPNSSLIAQLFWIGFRREFFSYSRRPRSVGRSAWNFSRKLRYMMDSIFSFTDLPILLVLWIGLFGCLASVLFGFVIAIARIGGFIHVPGYTSLVLLIVFFGSVSLAVQGIIGSYLWRTFENTKRRPLNIVSQLVENKPLFGDLAERPFTDEK